MPTEQTEIRISDVPAYVLSAHGQKISRGTAYNWKDKGRKGVKLATWMRGTITTTSKEAVDEFLRHCV